MPNLHHITATGGSLGADPIGMLGHHWCSEVFSLPSWYQQWAINWTVC